MVLLDLEVFAEISSSPAGQNFPPKDQSDIESLSTDVQKAILSAHGMNPYFTKFMVNLLKVFSVDRQLLEDRGPFVIR